MKRGSYRKQVSLEHFGFSKKGKQDSEPSSNDIASNFFKTNTKVKTEKEDDDVPLYLLCEAAGTPDNKSNEKIKERVGEPLNKNIPGNKNTVEKDKTTQLPLHKVFRPKTKEQYVDKIRSTKISLLKLLLEGNFYTHLIIYGNTGSGKSSLVSVLKHSTPHNFVYWDFSNTFAKELKRIQDLSIQTFRMTKKKTLLYLGDIDKFNKTQQINISELLSNHWILLIATSLDNPKHTIQRELRSRCQFLHLPPYEDDEMKEILEVIIKDSQFTIEKEAMNLIIKRSCGDARIAIGMFEMCMKLLDSKEKEKSNMSTNDNTKNIQLSVVECVLEHFSSGYSSSDHSGLTSALQKCIRGCDLNGALLYLMKSLKSGEDPIYISRRLIRIASEDIGFADENALSICVDTHYACKAIGMPECQTSLVFAVIYLCKASKSNCVYELCNRASKVCDSLDFAVPKNLLNHSEDYVYTNQTQTLSYEQHKQTYKGTQQYVPDNLKDLDLFHGL